MFLVQMTIYVIYGNFIICAYGKHHGLFVQVSYAFTSDDSSLYFHVWK